MVDYRSLENQLSETLALQRRPVSVTFAEIPPPGVPKFEGTEPSSCSFWRIAALGRTFYTIPADHYNCPIGCYTHNIPLPPNRSTELDDTLTLMTNIKYLRIEEVPGIARLPQTPKVVTYAPLGDTPVAPNVVLFAGYPERLMLLKEAVLRVGVGAHEPLLSRPTCMVLPLALTSGFVASLSCTGNRVYTQLGENEIYVALPGQDLPKVVGELQTIAEANAKLSEYHQARREELTTG